VRFRARIDIEGLRVVLRQAPRHRQVRDIPARPRSRGGRSDAPVREIDQVRGGYLGASVIFVV
jgi:hypothetical protein